MLVETAVLKGVGASELAKSVGSVEMLSLCLKIYPHPFRPSD